MRLGVLTKYLIKIHIGPFIFALATITGLIFLNAVAQRIEGLIGKGLPWTVVGEFLVLSLPHTIALSLPMSVLVAVLYSFTELASSNEITAMSAGGIKPTRVLLPLLGMGAVVTVAMLYFNDQILPESNHRLKNLLVDIGQKSPTLELREQIVNEIKTESGVDVYFMTADRIDQAANKLEEVTIFDSNSSIRKRTTYAASGEMAFNAEKTDLYLTLFDGVVHEVQTDRIGGFQRVYFDKQIIPLRDVGNELERRFGGSDRSDREMGFKLLTESVSSREEELDSVRIDSREKSLQALRLALGRPIDEDTSMVGTMEIYQTRKETQPSPTAPHCSREIRLRSQSSSRVAPAPPEEQVFELPQIAIKLKSIRNSQSPSRVWCSQYLAPHWLYVFAPEEWVWLQLVRVGSSRSTGSA